MPDPIAKVRGLLFDLDGTLVDSLEDLAAAAVYIRKVHRLKPISTSKIASYIGEGARTLVSRVLGTDDSSELDVMVPLFIHRYQDHCVDATRLYPGTAATLKVLAGRGYRLAVVTNKPARVSRRILLELGALSWFKAVIGGDSTGQKKPDPRPLLKACGLLRLGRAECAMIGDSRVDVEAGKAAGMRTIGIKGGIGSQRLLRNSRPDLLINNISGLKNIFSGQ